MSNLSVWNSNVSYMSTANSPIKYASETRVRSVMDATWTTCSKNASLSWNTGIGPYFGTINRKTSY